MIEYPAGIPKEFCLYNEDGHDSLHILCWLPIKYVSHLHTLGKATDYSLGMCFGHGLEIPLEQDPMDSHDIELDVDFELLDKAYTLLYNKGYLPASSMISFENLCKYSERLKDNGKLVLTDDEVRGLKKYVPQMFENEKR